MTIRPHASPPIADSDGWTPAALGVTPGRWDGWLAAKLVEPPRGPGPDGPELDVNDATLVRSVCRPDRPGTRPKNLRGTLNRLRAWLPAAADPPAAVTLVDAGNGRLLVRLDNGDLADPNGQFRFDFGGARGTWRIGPPTPTTAAGWHDRGVEQELAGDTGGAVASYARALLLDGPDAQVAFDLAHALADLGQHAAAVERYRQAVELDPLRQDAWVNLGDLLLATADAAGAVAAFRHALDLDPDDADAHYDLAEAFDLAGEVARAVPHWSAYLRLAGGGDRAAYVRHRLATLLHRT